MSRPDVSFISGLGAGYVAELVRLQAPSKIARLFAWIATPWTVRRAERRLTGRGAAIIGRFGAWPDAERPTFVFPLFSPASAYADAQLLPHAGGLAASLRRRFDLCHPSLAAIVVIGRMP